MTYEFVYLTEDVKKKINEEKKPQLYIEAEHKDNGIPKSNF